MEQTPLPPLVSDKALAQAHCLSDECLWLRLQYEADRLKTREVVQALVNMIHHRYMDHPADTLANAKYYASGGPSTVDALALVKSQLNIEPSKP
jgi:hypothetical protein